MNRSFGAARPRRSSRARAIASFATGKASRRSAGSIASTWRRCLGRSSSSRVTPMSPILMRISSSRISSARTSPASPPAASAQHCRRPTQAAFAPSATALSTSVPRQIPPSTITSARPADRLDDLGKRVERPRCVIELPAAVVGHVDGVYSGSTARAASSRVAMPFRTTGRPSGCRMRSIVRQVRRAGTILAWAALNVSSPARSRRIFWVAA